MPNHDQMVKRQKLLGEFGEFALRSEFEFPGFMEEQGIVAIVNVPVFLPGGKAYGLLQVDSLEPREFGKEDQEFLRTYATILGPVIDRLHKIHDLQVALNTNRHLLQELQHRIKNHIGTITSLVRLRRREVRSDEARQELTAVGERIEALRLVHEQLYAGGTADQLPVRPYVTRLAENLCRMHEGQSGQVRLDIAIGDVEFTPETAVPIGLILNEFITNSLKYAFDGQGGTIAVGLQPLAGGRVHVCLSDNGKGLPGEPRPSAPGFGTGMKLIDGLARQLGAEPAWSSANGTALCLEFVPQ